MAGEHTLAEPKVKVTARRCIPTNPQPMSLPNINFLYLTVSEIQPRQDFIGQGHYGKVKGQIKVTP